MTRSTPEGEPVTVERATKSPGSLDSRELLLVTLRFVAGLLAILVIVAVLGHAARDRCEAAARVFVDRYGYAGMALGTLLADAIHFPIPPQFYMLLSVASGASAINTLAAIAAASLTAGVLGYRLARVVGRNAWVSKRTERTRRLLQGAIERYGAWAAVYSSLLPLPYSLLCYLAGLSRAPRGFFALLCVCRVPKLVAFYWLIRLGWQPD